MKKYLKIFFVLAILVFIFAASGFSCYPTVPSTPTPVVTVTPTSIPTPTFTPAPTSTPTPCSSCGCGV